MWPNFALFIISNSNNEILLLRRIDTPFCNQCYSLPGGKIEVGETATQTIIREAKNSLNLTINFDYLKFAHAMHRKCNEPEFFACVFKVEHWEGEPCNQEPERHDDMLWFDVNRLPSTMVPAHKHAIECIKKGITYWSMDGENKAMKKLVMYVIIFTQYFSYQLNAAERLSTKENIRLMARSLVYWPEGVVAFTHEMGHALAAKALLNSPVNVHVGAYWEELSKEKQKSEGEKPGVSIHGFDFSKGYCCYKKPRNVNEVFIINSSGPIAGIVATLGLMKFMNVVSASNRPAKILVESLKHIIRYEMLHQTVFGLTPLYQTTDGDGYRIWQSAGASQQILKRISKFDSKRALLCCCLNVFRLKWLYELMKIITID